MKLEGLEIIQHMHLDKEFFPGLNQLYSIKICVVNYRTRAIITRGLYIFYPLFEGQKRFFKGLFS